MLHRLSSAAYDGNGHLVRIGDPVSCCDVPKPECYERIDVCDTCAESIYHRHVVGDVSPDGSVCHGCGAAS